MFSYSLEQTHLFRSSGISVPHLGTLSGRRPIPSALTQADHGDGRAAFLGCECVRRAARKRVHTQAIRRVTRKRAPEAELRKPRAARLAYRRQIFFVQKKAVCIPPCYRIHVPSSGNGHMSPLQVMVICVCTYVYSRADTN